MKPKLKMTFDAGWGESYSLWIDLDEDTARNIEDIKPPDMLDNFDVAVEKIRIREFRKDLLVDAANRLARQLAERMEDAEGWHDASRIEPAKESLRSWN